MRSCSDYTLRRVEGYMFSGIRVLEARAVNVCLRGILLQAKFKTKSRMALVWAMRVQRRATRLFAVYVNSTSTACKMPWQFEIGCCHIVADNRLSIAIFSHIRSWKSNSEDLSV